MLSENAEKFYTEVVDAKMGADYEATRWHKDAFSHALYDMTKDTIVSLVAEKVVFSSCLELGAGAGTWTRELVMRHKDASYDFVDISPVMLKKVEDALSSLPSLGLKTRFFVSDFNTFTSDREYEFFFSIRALEYVTDKKSAVLLIAKLVGKGGHGFIITKTPHYLRAMLRGRSYSSLHTGQISPRALYLLCHKAGLTDIKLYPVTFTFPFVRNEKLYRFLYRLFGKKPLSFLSQFFSESYAISFTKP